MYSRRNRNKNYLLSKQKDNDRFLQCIHRATVTDVHIDKGTVNVEFEDINYSDEVTIPLLGLSMPPKKSESDANELSSSWGRYIPQENDVLLVGFSPNGKLYSLGYHAVFYEGFTQKDTDRESTGGIGWGESSAKKMKPGDWDFKSARNSALYLGDKVKLSSGPHSILVNNSSGDITSKSSLLVGQYGSSSESRKGGARRKILPTDSAETSIYNLQFQVAQESTDVVRSGFPQLELTRTSMGDVVDELTFQVMPSLTGGTVVRRLEAVKDPFGITDLYAKKVDDLGNCGIEAPTALLFQWLTPASTWNIVNTTTTIASSTAYNITAPAVAFTAPTSFVVTSPNVQLGSPAAVDFVVKGTTFMTALSAFLAAIAAAGATNAAIIPPTPIGNGAMLVAITTAAAALASALAGTLSLKVKTE